MVIGIILGIIALIFIPHIAVSFFLFMKFFYSRKTKKSEKIFYENEDYLAYHDVINEHRETLLKREHQEVQIVSFDKLKLVADYYPNSGDKIAILVHGYKSLPTINFAYIGNRLFLEGYSLLIVDQRAHSRSEGHFITYGCKEGKDVISWVNYVKENLNKKEIILYGISMGAASCAYASKDVQVNHIVLDSCYPSANALIQHLCPPNPLFRYCVLPFASLYSKMFIGLFIKDIDIKNSLENNTNHIVFVHGGKDRIAPVSFLDENVIHVKDKKDIILVADAPHAMPMIEGKEEAWKQLIQYIR